MITRGFIGKDGADYVIAFTKPGKDYYSAADDDFIFNSAAPSLKPLLEGTVTIPNGTTQIPFPKSFGGIPLIMVGRDVGTNSSVQPGNGFTVSYYRDRDYFAIVNTTGGTATFSYIVFDNELS